MRASARPVGVVLPTATRNVRHHSAGGNHPNTAVVRVYNPDVARPIHGYTTGIIKAGGGAGPVFAAAAAVVARVGSDVERRLSPGRFPGPEKGRHRSEEEVGVQTMRPKQPHYGMGWGQPSGKGVRRGPHKMAAHLTTERPFRPYSQKIPRDTGVRRV